MEYEKAIELAPNGWRHFAIEDIDRLPDPVRRREIARLPAHESEERVLRALFWPLVFHLEPERWDELSRCEPIHPDLIGALPQGGEVAVEVGAGSGRLTAHLVRRYSRVVAIEPSAGLRDLLRTRLPQVDVIAGWAECLPLRGHVAHLTTACGAFGPDPSVLSELVRVTAPGGSIVLINPEEPEWFEEHDWSRITAPRIAPPAHAAWIDDFFGAPDPPRDMVALHVR